MPAISTSSKVLLTGGSGFVGAQNLNKLLEDGFSVRAVVRSEQKASYLRNRFSEHGDKLEFVIIEDFSTPGSLDEAVKGVEGIVHTATSIKFFEPDSHPNAWIEPSVNMIVELLRSATKSPSVKRVVFTSSMGAVGMGEPGKKLYTEDDWFEAAPKIAEEQGKDAPMAIKYCASKMLSEKAAWAFMEEHKPAFDLVALVPSFVWGEMLNDASPQMLGSNMRLLGGFTKAALENPTDEALLDELHGVDARDSAKLHSEALVNPKAGGNRIIVHSATFTPQHVLNYLNAHPIEGFTVPKGKPELLNGWTPKVDNSNKKSKEMFGITYRPFEEIVNSTVTSALKLGWKQ
ncbi:NAD(P)-binding protein [Serendipita vermifera]|nr:NAD(P)-binding protein [Serendipita vermifera]